MTPTLKLAGIALGCAFLAGFCASMLFRHKPQEPAPRHVAPVSPAPMAPATASATAGATG